VIDFIVTPLSVSWTKCPGTAPQSQTLTLNNIKSTVAVRWQASAVQTVLNAPWATITDVTGAPVSSGTVPAGKSQTIIVNPYPASPVEICRYSSPNGTNWTVKIATANAGTDTFVYTVY
jgi:hypothetical protein